MSRYNSWTNVSPILAAAEKWKIECFRGHGSILSKKQRWLSQYFLELEKYFVNNPDESKGLNFLEKFEKQLQPISPEGRQFAAECLWILLLFARERISPAAKRDLIRKVWAWSGDTLSEDHSMLSDDVLSGIGNSGVAFNTLRPLELMFCIKTIVAFKRETSTEQKKMIADPWLFGEWISQIPGHASRQFRQRPL